MQKLVYIFLLILSFLFLSACSEPEEPEIYGEITPQIIFLFSPGGLGDMSYNDCILEGVQKFKRSHPEVDVFLYSPESMDAAERIFSDWMKRPGSNIPVIFALASSDFEPLVDSYTEQFDLTDNKRILMFESLHEYEDPKISTFHVSMFGASYLAGVTASECTGKKPSLILLGSSTDEPIESARDGFISGLDSDNYNVSYLANDWTGYVMANITYQRMAEWTKEYGFIFPVAGGSNTGIYRYSREYENSPYLAGMDVDQSYLSTKITGSVIKRFDLLVEEYFNEWLGGGEMPHFKIYGLESGYVDWVIATRYGRLFGNIVELYRPAAIAAERRYYEIL